MFISRLGIDNLISFSLNFLCKFHVEKNKGKRADFLDDGWFDFDACKLVLFAEFIIFFITGRQTGFYELAFQRADLYVLDGSLLSRHANLHFLKPIILIKA